MILYSYKLKNFNNALLECLPDNIKIQNNDKNNISGSVTLDDFTNEFIITSNFLFIIANRKSQKRKSYKFLHSLFNGHLSFFRPTYDEKYDFLSSYKHVALKFIHDNEIQYSNDLTNKYFKKTINSNYYLFEANIKLDSSDDYFLYYGDAIKIKDKFKNNLTDVINVFESGWLI